MLLPEDVPAVAMPPRDRHGVRLRAVLRLAEPALAAACGRFWRHPRLAELFPAYLLRVLASARASLAVIAAARRRAEELAAGDPVAARLADYYAAHHDEEAGHAEWLVSDLESIGVPRSRALASWGSPAVASMVGAQYYWLEHAHPVAPLGYFAVLEGYPPAASHLEELQERTGLPRSAFRFLRAHAEIDPHHAADLYRLLDELPLSAAQAGLVGTSALATVAGLAAVFEELVAAPAAAEAPVPAAAGG